MTIMSFTPPAHVLHPDFGKRQRVFTYPRDLTEIVIEANEERMARHSKRAEYLEEFVGTDEHFPKMMHYDLELAPNVTGRELLLCHGIVPVPPQELKSPLVLHDELWTIIEALALNGVFLLNTDHLSDSELYARMYYAILNESTRAVPPSDQCSEFIDLAHPMDVEFPKYKAMVTRDGQHMGPNVTKRTSAYERGMLYLTVTTLAERDRSLPKPSDIFGS
jgi:hypothetical protein